LVKGDREGFTKGEEKERGAKLLLKKFTPFPSPIPRGRGVGGWVL